MDEFLNRFKQRNYLIFSIAFLLLVGVYATSKLHHKPISKNQIPISVRGKLDFRALYPPPETQDGWTYVPDSAKIDIKDNGDKIFSFIIRSSRADITFSEQAYPEALIYDNLVNSIGLYAETGSLYGKISLGKSKDGKIQTAVLKYGEDALIFGRSNHNLSDSEWRQAFNTLAVSG